MNLFTKQKQTHRFRKTNQWLPNGHNGERNKLGDCTIHNIDNQGPTVYSTKNYTQYSVITYIH